MRLLMRRAAGVLMIVGLLTIGVTGTGYAAGAGAPRWKIVSISNPTNFKPGETTARLEIVALNVGGQATDGSTVTVADNLPLDLSVRKVSGFDVYRDKSFFGPGRTAPLTCESLPTIACSETQPVDPGDMLYMEIALNEIGTELPAFVANEATVTGGGAPSATATTPADISMSPASFGFSPESVAAELSTLQAGGHPNLTTLFSMSRSEAEVPAETPPKDIRFDVPVGLVANALDTPRCSMAKVVNLLFDPQSCPRDTMVGMATVFAKYARRSHYPLTIVTPVYNIAPAPGEPMALAFDAVFFQARLDASVLSDGTYGARVTASDISEGAETVLNAITVWGVPAEHNGPGQDLSFMLEGLFTGGGDPSFGGPGAGARVAFLTNPTQCATPLTSTASTDSWAGIGAFVSQTAESGTLAGCEQVPFSSSFSMLPDTTQAGAPVGYYYDLKIPREEDTSPAALAQADVRKTVVRLPLGTVISPSIADGLGVCRDDIGVDPGGAVNEFGLHYIAPASCEQASQVGTVQITSPLLSKALDGQVYLGEPECDPCTAQDAEDGKMVKLLLQVRGEGEDGITVKIGGSIAIDQRTGQITATFNDTPQLPFDELKLSLGGGSRAALANPRTCGPATTTTTLTPWTSPIVPDLERTFSYEVSGCYAPQFKPFFVAGTTSNQAGGYSPFTLSFGRSDADQFLAGIKTTMPPGVLGSLSHVALCGEPQAAEGTCGADSQIGHVQVLTGPGATPFLVTSGKVFITGPYKGAPYGLSIVVPAKAGPYTIAGANGTGTVVVRAAVNVDPTTAALTVASDPFPTVLDGIPLQLKRVDVSIDRPEFVFNPTTCNKLGIGATITSTEGASADTGSSFQVTNCAALGFKPKFSVSTSAHTSRDNGASLVAKLSYPSAPFGSQANIAKVRVELPEQLPSRLTTLQKACPDATFNADPAACPAASRVGEATATTPLLPVPISGPAYFVSHGGAKFPELVIALSGYGTSIYLRGETFISKAGVTSTSFNSVPDVPIGTFQLTLPQGPDSALAANGDLCAQKLVMPTQFTAQNGTQLEQKTPITVEGCTPEIRVIRHSVSGKHATVVVNVPAAGTLTASGGGVMRATRRIGKAGTVTLELRLTKAEQRFVARHHGRRLRVPIKLSFKPGRGKNLHAIVAVLMR